jgi:hypothetical protein
MASERVPAQPPLPRGDPVPLGGRDRERVGLGPGRMRMESYRGFVFGSFAVDDPTLREHLGTATGAHQPRASTSFIRLRLGL